jgi:RNA polymerase sigma factor (sigma-70 family)
MNPIAAPARGDQELMTQLGAGSAEALGELYDRYCQRAYRVALSVCSHATHAEEAVESAFESIWIDRGTYRDQPGTVAAWLLSLVFHRAIEIADSKATSTARTGSERTYILARLDGVPVAQREVITLAFYGGLSHTEIAARLGLPEDTVKARMRLGLRKLQTELGAEDRPARTAPSRRPPARATRLRILGRGNRTSRRERA